MSSPEWDNWIDPGYGFESYSIAGIVTAAANIRIGDNPPYQLSDFLAMYPQFGALDGSGVYTGPFASSLPLQTYLTLANATLMQLRWQDSWTFAMGLFIAHYATLYLQASAPSGATAKQVAQSGLAKGVLTAKSVGDVSASYQQIATGWEEWGQWNLTLFGQQLIQMAALVGLGPMYVW